VEAPMRAKIVSSSQGFEVVTQAEMKGALFLAGSDGDGSIGAVVGKGTTTSPLSFGVRWFVGRTSTGWAWSAPEARGQAFQAAGLGASLTEIRAFW
jgi:hypothetical protein